MRFPVKQPYIITNKFSAVHYKVMRYLSNLGELMNPTEMPLPKTSAGILKTFLILPLDSPKHSTKSQSFEQSLSQPPKVQNEPVLFFSPTFKSIRSPFHTK